jgi:hypothetical protein
MTRAQVRARFAAIVERALARAQREEAAHYAALRAAAVRDGRRALAASRTHRASGAPLVLDDRDGYAHAQHKGEDAWVSVQ